MRDLGHGLNIQNVVARVADSLAIDHPRFGRDRFAEVFGIVRLDENEVITKPPQRRVELCERASIEGACGHDLVARRGNGGDGQELSGLTAGETEGRHAVFE